MRAVEQYNRLILRWNVIVVIFYVTDALKNRWITRTNPIQCNAQIKYLQITGGVHWQREMRTHSIPTMKRAGRTSVVSRTYYRITSNSLSNAVILIRYNLHKKRLIGTWWKIVSVEVAREDITTNQNENGDGSFRKVLLFLAVGIKT